MGRYAHWLEPGGPSEEPIAGLHEPGEPAIPPGWIDRFTRDQKAFIRRRIPLDAPDLRLITREELPHYFEHDEDINLSGFTLTFVFQYFYRLLEGQDQPIRGNIRSFWYRKLTRHLERLGLLEPPGGLAVTATNKRGRYILKRMENAFENLFKEGFFHYRELGIYNHRERFRKSGRRYKRHLFYTEKEGLFWFCEEMHSQFSLHVYASRGSASWLDVDYLAQAIADLNVRTLYVAALTDYDPWGLFIAHQIKTKLETRFFGFKRVHLVVLTDLGIFDSDTVHQVKRYLLKDHEDPNDPVHKIVMEWVRNGGGIDGEPYGVHVDHADWSRVRSRIQQWLRGTWFAEPMTLEVPKPLERKLQKQLEVDG